MSGYPVQCTWMIYEWILINPVAKGETLLLEQKTHTDVSSLVQQEYFAQNVMPSR